MDWSIVLIVNNKEYARVMGTKFVGLCLRVLCIKPRAIPRCVEGDTVKILSAVRILGNNFRKLPSKRGFFFEMLI